MQSIRKFVDFVANADRNSRRDVVISLADAKQLRDDLLKLLAERNDTTVEVKVDGGKW